MGEAAVLASLSRHPNICRIVGLSIDEATGPTRGHMHIATELTGCSLFHLLHRPHSVSSSITLPLGSGRATQIARGICAGATQLHSQQLVHADLKSANVLIDFQKDPP